MPFENEVAYACQNLQAAYVDYYKKNAAQYRTGGSTALLKYLLSPQNTRGFERINVTSIPGKKRGVAFRVDSPMCFDLCNPAVTCATDREPLEVSSGEVVFELDGPAFRVCDGDGKPVRLTFSREDMAKYCKDNDTTFITNQIARYLQRFEEAFDKKMMELIEPQAGTNADGDALTRLPFFVNNPLVGTSTLNPDALFWLDQHYASAGNEGQYGLVGGMVLNKINRFAKWAGLNAGGIDLSKIDDATPYSYYDRHADAILGTDNFLQLAPGVVQLVTFNENAGPYKGTVSGLYSNGSITLPSTGLTIDWDWRYDYDCKVWTFEAYVHAELAVNRAGGCGNLSTVNGIIRYEDCSGGIAAPECPEIVEE